MTCMLGQNTCPFTSCVCESFSLDTGTKLKLYFDIIPAIYTQVFSHVYTPGKLSMLKACHKSTFEIPLYQLTPMFVRLHAPVGGDLRHGRV